MKLYVVDGTGAKRHLNTKASSRKELANTLGGEYFEIEGSVFHVSQVFAEKTGDSTCSGQLKLATVLEFSQYN
ncbi:hypothetical protein ACOCGP_003633, partial [Vibrio cholerae]